MRWRTTIILFITLTLSAPAQFSSSSLTDVKVAAEKGDAAAQHKLGDTFIGRADSQQAEVWYRKAAEQGYAPSQGKLGNMLLMRSRSGFNGTAEQRAAMGDEAVKWATLAANQGDTRGQADLADVYFEGKLVKPDLVEAYKWGDLAGQGSMIDVATIAGRGTRNSALLKMSSDQITEAKKRVAAFVPRKLSKQELPEPQWVKQITLTGLSGPAERRLAIINGRTFAVGETTAIKVGDKSVKVRCVEIRDKSALVEIEGLSKAREIALPTTQ